MMILHWSFRGGYVEDFLRNYCFKKRCVDLYIFICTLYSICNEPLTESNGMAYNLCWVEMLTCQM